MSKPLIMRCQYLPQVSSKDGKALGSPGKPDFQGEAHKLYMQHGKVHSNSVSQ